MTLSAPRILLRMGKNKNGREEAHSSVIKRILTWLKRALAALMARKYATIAGALAFFLAMSIVPFSFWLVLLFGQSGLHIEEILALEVFDWAKDLLVFFKENAAGATSGAGIFLLLTTLWSSSSFFYHLRRSGELLYDYRRLKKGWKVRISSVLLTLGVMLFFAGAGALFVYIFSLRLPRAIYYPTVYSLLLTLGLFAALILNFYVCPYRCSMRDIFLGSFLTALFWLMASGIFSLSLLFSHKEKLYGALTLVILFLLWLYWMMICFVAGAIYNRYRMRLKGMEHKTL